MPNDPKLQRRVNELHDQLEQTRHTWHAQQQATCDTGTPQLLPTSPLSYDLCLAELGQARGGNAAEQGFSAQMNPDAFDAWCQWHDLHPEFAIVETGECRIHVGSNDSVPPGELRIIDKWFTGQTWVLPDCALGAPIRRLLYAELIHSGLDPVTAAQTVIDAIPDNSTPSLEAPIRRSPAATAAGYTLRH